MITIKTIFNKRLSRFEFLDLKKSQSKRTLDVGLFTFGIVCAVFLLGLVLLLCLTRSEESSTIVRRRPITFSPDLGQFPLSIENNNFNDNIELGIVHEEGTDNNLDQCFSTFFSSRNPFDLQKILRISFAIQKNSAEPFCYTKKLWATSNILV